MKNYLCLLASDYGDSVSDADFDDGWSISAKSPELAAAIFLIRYDLKSAEVYVMDGDENITRIEVEK
jgi:hypothetical protein